ncbi:metal ABC transporter substrate-binding protein [Nostocoides sp. Soil756]|uniref:metal ABC transporter substrate-binding protein n=1 Tax=Nostocoides sp. Soil756 TaxID=1736399 RepID=UPI000B25BBD2|nr:metal ABC transporter substrate-binding protein [Tetrasphaera sp. Soil756]
MKRVVLALCSAAVLALTACSGAGGSASADGRLAVTASFYPLQWAAEQVGGDHVTVTSLTRPGAEPHDLELTPKDVGALGSSQVVVYLSGFQPAVDDAVRSQAQDAAFDVAPAADLSITAAADGGAGTARDPHFWLDPVRFEKVVTAIGERFATVDPAHAAEYRAHAAALVERLAALDQKFRTGLASCRSNELVTGHVAFAYLAQRYGLSQEGIAGLSPEAEPDAATLRDLAAYVQQHGVTTVYTETLASPALVETLARETGAKVAVLDPVEGITSASQGGDYLEVMRSNLETLRAGQECR